MKKQYTKYTITQKRGMEGIGDMELEWLTPEQVEQRWKDYREYQEQCKQDGTYGQKYDLVIEMEHDPTLDYIPKTKSLETSVSFQIVDWSDER